MWNCFSYWRQKPRQRDGRPFTESLGFFLILQHLQRLLVNCVAHSSGKIVCWENSSKISLLPTPFHFPTESVPGGVISNLTAKPQGCSWKCFTFSLKSSLFIHYCGWCFQLVLDDESHVKFRGMLFLNGYPESILLCLKLLKIVNKICIQAHRNQMHF